jgi:radical SAM protein with 4Fe4S-binding SPASM domain
MVNPRLKINNYPNQGYKIIFNQNTGLLIRLENNNSPEPFWCEDGPELIDISITNWCDRECGFCYKESANTGNHMEINNYRRIIRQAARMKVLQVALGGGNPNQHPEFCDILRMTREEFNIVPSYTTNGRGINTDVLIASKKYCGAVAVSAYEPFKETYTAACRLIDEGIRTNLHFLLTSKTISTAIQWLKNPPVILSRINAIIFLNYKAVGRNPNQELIVKNTKDVRTFFRLAQEKYPFKIGFDSCSISGITRLMNTNPIFVERCEASRFSMYISEDMKMYPCSFMINQTEGVPIIDENILVTWRRHASFVKIRELLRTNNCTKCSASNTCFGGCPVFKEINICTDY